MILTTSSDALRWFRSRRERPAVDSGCPSVRMTMTSSINKMMNCSGIIAAVDWVDHLFDLIDIHNVEDKVRMEEISLAQENIWDDRILKD